MNKYKVVVQKSPGWKNHKVATLGVSVSSPHWRGEKFASILAFAAANFDIIRIDVTDALYRHNFMAEGLAPEQALAQANAFGALWLTQHQEIIDECPIIPRVIRWAKWYEDPDYRTALSGFQKAYNTNVVLRDAIENDLTNFYRRQQQLPSSKEREHSINFIIEELAILSLQARNLPGARIYPGSEVECLKVVRHGFVPQAPQGLECEQFVEVAFKKRHQKVPSFPGNRFMSQI